jgi:integrase
VTALVRIGCVRQSKRTISLPASAVSMLRTHRKEQLELDMQLGIRTDLVFQRRPSRPRLSDNGVASGDVEEEAAAGQIPCDAAHPRLGADRQRHRCSRRLGHANPTITLNTYAHLFDKTDNTAATAIDKLLAN